MPAGPSQIYFFLDSTNRSVYLDNGILAYSATPRPLQYPPDGWKQIAIADQRNITTWTLDIDFTIPLNFVMDGAQILKIYFSTKGTEEKLTLAIMEQKLFYDGANYYYFYTLLYKSQVDFSNYNHVGAKVSVNMLNQNFAQSLKSNAAKTYQYNLADSRLPFPVYMDGIELAEKGNFQVVDGVTFTGRELLDFPVPFVLLNQEGASAGVQFKSQEYEILTEAFPDYFNNSGNWCAQVDALQPTAITFPAAGQVTFKCTENEAHDASVDLFFGTNLGQRIHLTFLPAEIPIVGHTYTYSINFPVTLAPGEKLFLMCSLFGPSVRNNMSIVFNPNSKLSFQFNNRFKATLIKAFDLFEVFSLLINSITGGAFAAAASELISRVSLKIAITSGDGIRGIAGALLKLTWNNFWSFVNMYEDAGLYVIGNQVHLERKEDCINFSSVIDLGQVSGLGVSPANAVKFNSLKIGTSNQDYGATNGKDEFNTTLEMSNDIVSVSAVLAFLSDIRVDGFGFEFIRTGLDGKSTTDNIADGAPCALHINGLPTTVSINGVSTQVYELERSLNPYCSGVLFPASVFNLALSPKQCLYRKGNYLISCLNMQEGKKMTFRNLDKNQGLQVISPTGRPVIEKSDEPIGDLGIPYFKPVLYDCIGFSSNDIIEVRKRNPTSVIRFNIDNITYVCLPMKEGVQPATDAAQAYQFMAGPDNDITRLNNYYGD